MTSDCAPDPTFRTRLRTPTWEGTFEYEWVTLTTVVLFGMSRAENMLERIKSHLYLTATRRNLLAQPAHSAGSSGRRS